MNRDAMEQRDVAQHARKLEAMFGQGVWRWGCSDCGRTGTLAGVWGAAMSAALNRHQAEGLAFGERCRGALYVERDRDLDPGSGVPVYRPDLGLGGVFAAAIAREENRRLFAESFRPNPDVPPLPFDDFPRGIDPVGAALDRLADRFWAFLRRNGFPGWRKH